MAGAQVPLSESWKPVRLGDGKTSKKVSIHSLGQYSGGKGKNVKVNFEVKVMVLSRVWKGKVMKLRMFQRHSIQPMV